MDREKADRGIGINPFMNRDTVQTNRHNVPLSDKRIKQAGLDPNDFLGVGLTEEVLTERLKAARSKTVVAVKPTISKTRTTKE